MKTIDLGIDTLNQMEKINKYKKYLLENLDNTIDYIKSYNSYNIKLFNDILLLLLLLLRENIIKFEITEYDEINIITHMEKCAYELNELMEIAQENEETKIKIKNEK